MYESEAQLVSALAEREDMADLLVYRVIRLSELSQAAQLAQAQELGKERTAHAEEVQRLFTEANTTRLALKDVETTTKVLRRVNGRTTVALKNYEDSLAFLLTECLDKIWEHASPKARSKFPNNSVWQACWRENPYGAVTYEAFLRLGR
jgi:hypothetical protein